MGCASATRPQARLSHPLTTSGRRAPPRCQQHAVAAHLLRVPKLKGQRSLVAEDSFELCLLVCIPTAHAVHIEDKRGGWPGIRWCAECTEERVDQAESPQGVCVHCVRVCGKSAHHLTSRFSNSIKAPKVLVCHATSVRVPVAL